MHRLPWLIKALMAGVMCLLLSTRRLAIMNAVARLINLVTNILLIRRRMVPILRFMQFGYLILFRLLGHIWVLANSMVKLVGILRVQSVPSIVIRNLLIQRWLCIVPQIITKITKCILRLIATIQVISLAANNKLSLTISFPLPLVPGLRLGLW